MLTIFLILCVGEKQNLISKNPCNKTQLLESLLQNSIDYTGANQFFHFEKFPERLPLKIFKNDSISKEIKLKKEGEEIQFIVDSVQYALYFTTIKITNNTAKVIFEYPLEGMEVELYFRKVDCYWELEEDQITER